MNVNYRVVALDPGGTTGWAKYDAEIERKPGSITARPKIIHSRIDVGQLGPHEHHEELYDMLEEFHIRDFYLVTESFEFRNGKQRDNINLMSREYIGVSTLFAQQRNLGKRYIKYTAGQAKKFVPDKPVEGLEANAKLKAMGWYFPGQKHANDAVRHLVYFLVNNQKRTDLVQSWRNLT